MVKLGLIALAIAVVLLLGSLAYGKGVVRSAVGVLSNFVLGFGSLYAINLFSGQLGFAIPLNGTSLALSGLLGLPGTMFSAALQLFLPV